MRLLTFLARRFVAGETTATAIAAGRRLAQKGIHSTFDLLGEDVLDETAARRSAEAVRTLITSIPEDIERNVSIKLSMMGLGVSRDLCLELVAGILDAARQAGGFIRIDMEGSSHTQATLDVFHRLRQSHDHLGIVLQAYLHRTEEDVRRAIARRDRVRLCKGAYHEPPSIAIQDMNDIRANFRKCARFLLEEGNRPALATHDESLIQDAIGYSRERQIPVSRFEFQMLYGLRRRRWESLVREGYSVRIYVPYGTHWFPYLYRRLRERKENVFFILKNLFR